MLTLHSFGRGKAVYMGGFAYAPESARMLLEMLLYLTGTDGKTAGMTDQPQAECAWYPATETLVVMNNSNRPLDVKVSLSSGPVRVHTEPFEMKFV